MMENGGYEDGYRSCPCFWGEEPARLVRKAAELLATKQVKCALDLGCGEGKNAAFLAKNGFAISAIDVSALALSNAQRQWQDLPVCWIRQDIRRVDAPDASYDLVIATGPLHCLSTDEEILAVIQMMQRITRPGGLNVLSAFNDRAHDFSGHGPNFHPHLMAHVKYVVAYKGWELLEASDEDLEDVHPHNVIPHLHSITRILARKI